MKYRLRFKDRTAYKVSLADLKEKKDVSEIALEKIEFDEVVTVFTVVAGAVLQYSTATKNSRLLCRMVCFDDEDSRERYVKCDDRELFHTVEELSETIELLKSDVDLKVQRLISYEWNDGEEIQCHYEIGREYDGNVCAGFLVNQNNEVKISPIMVEPKDWEVFLKMYEIGSDKHELVLSLLLGGV